MLSDRQLAWNRLKAQVRFWVTPRLYDSGEKRTGCLPRLRYSLWLGRHGLVVQSDPWRLYTTKA